MKIISQGQIPGTKPIRTTCGRCRTIFEFLPIEAKFCSDQRDGPFYSIGCPVCSEMVYQHVRSGDDR